METDILVVEGWVHQFVINSAVAEFQKGRYKRVYVTGGPTSGTGPYSNDYNTSAGVGASRLKAAGLPPEAVYVTASKENGRDRTFNSAVALRRWLQKHNLPLRSMNIVTEGVHGRRSRLLFGMAFGDETSVGIISVPSPDYDAKHWWRYSEGVKDVISEGAAYLYARLFFHPDK